MIEELKKRIEAYLAESKHRTLHGLSSKSGVSYSTVRRIEQGEGKAVELVSVLGILKVVSSLSDNIAFLKEYFPAAGSYFETVAKTTHIDELYDETGEDLLYDPDQFVIVALAG